MVDFPGFIKELPEIDIPLAGVTGHLLQGQDQQVAFIRFDADTVVPEHSHRAQWELVLAGSVRLDLEGAVSDYGPGQHFFVPAGARHGAHVKAGYRAVIFFDQPDRYRPK